MVSCPLCKNESLIRTPHHFQSHLFFYKGFRGDGSVHFAQIREAEQHQVRGENCWVNGAPAYRGVRRTSGQRRFVEVFTPSWLPLSPLPSQAVQNHSPDGFEWGYPGSGPAQLALGILMDHTGDVPFAQRYYHLFKEAYVACWCYTWQVTVESLNIFRDEVVPQWEEDHREHAQDQALEKVKAARGGGIVIQFTRRDIVIMILGLLLILALSVFIAQKIVPTENKPKEAHLEAVDQVHRGFHKGNMPHMWFHQMITTKQRRIGI